MKRLYIVVLIMLILPVFAYTVFDYKNYSTDTYGDNLLFVVDFSNSMSEHLEHVKKINQVKDVLSKVLPQISENTNLGIRVYGHTCNVLAFNACRSSELLVPLGKNNAYTISHAISKLHPKGMTPITYSLKQAVKKDLPDNSETKHIILLTDGGENCDESPCDYSIELVKNRKDIKIDVIAFDVHDSDDLAQLQCTADVTGGKFIEAKTNSQLIHSFSDLISSHKQVEAVLYGAN